MLPRELFADYVRDALANLYDPASLQTHPLVSLVASHGAPQEAASQRLRQIFIEAIETLRPAGQVPFGRPEWLGYRVLWLRYVECYDQAEICRELGLGRTSFYNHLRQALDAITSLLWARYQEEQAASRPGAQGRAPGRLACEEAMKAASTAQRQWLSLSSVLDGARDTIMPLARHHGIDLVLEAPASLPSTYGDPAILRQIILNVLTEAVSLAGAGQIKLSVSEGDGETMWRLQGLPGTGAREWDLEQRPGIAVSEGLLTVYGGRLWVERDGQGAPALWFSVPVGRPETVLIIDDNADAVDLYRRYLQSEDLILQVAHSGDEAQAILAEAIPDLVLLDVLMPQQDGWSILQRLKTMPETAAIPVVICSVLSQPDLAMVLGAGAVLQKPIDQPALLRTVRALLTRAGNGV